MQDVITKDKIEALPDHSELRVMVGSIITRAAREKIKEKGITLQYVKENSENKAPDQEKKDGKERLKFATLFIISSSTNCGVNKKDLVSSFLIIWEREA